MAIELVKLNKMIINPSFKNDGGYKSYLEAEGTVNTDNNVKPLPPKGHLVDDNFADGVKYFFKDIGYDMKSVRNGYKGVANDHQLGRLNDVGLRLGGIAIAIYLSPTRLLRVERMYSSESAVFEPVNLLYSSISSSDG